MANTFYINWQDPASRAWHPVGRLVRSDGWYFFGYTKGAKNSALFLPFGNMGDLNSAYVSQQLFPIFANRVMNEKRPEYSRYALWSGLEGEATTDPLLLMARMEGARATDTLQVYPVPERAADGVYRTVFFSHGLRHLPNESQYRVENLKPGERIFPMLDVQNPFDHQAVAFRTGDPAALVGYCPRYLAPDVAELSKDKNASLEITVKRVNHDAPAQYRLLCEAVALWPEHFWPCDDSDHETIAHFDVSELSRQVSSQWKGRGQQGGLF